MKRLISRGLRSILAIIFITGYSTNPAHAQAKDQIIVLNPVSSPITPKEFYIEKIKTRESGNTSPGTIMTPGGTSPLIQNLVLKGGIEQAIRQFISQSVKANRSLRPITANIKEFVVSESSKSSGLVNGRIQLVISFEIIRNGEPFTLIEYKGGSRYTRSLGQVSVLEPAIGKSIINAFQYFDTWINREAPTNELLAKKVYINLQDFERELKNDTLFYVSGRNLSWSDFMGKPQASSRFAAEIFPFFSFEESRRITDGVIRIDLRLKSYMVRSFSWVKDYARNASTLNHEQRHFDLVKIASERFKQGIKNEDVRVDTYEGILSVQYLDCLREMNRQQVLYDQETKHGTDPAAQEKWNMKIDRELKSFKLVRASQ
jgi:hypothetical protein